MARRCRMLPVPGFSDCSWAECDVDRGRSVATRNALERANLILEGYFRALLPVWYYGMELIPLFSVLLLLSAWRDVKKRLPLVRLGAEEGIAEIRLLQVPSFLLCPWRS